MAGTITVLDDCTFGVSGWEFDGEGPDVAWWAATAEGKRKEFPYPANAIQVAELVPQGLEGTSPNYVAGEWLEGELWFERRATITASARLSKRLMHERRELLVEIQG